ncbi:MAG: hypothetical protein HKN33_15915 [Pyrinomonadaceae bacterium]|nr:hypothetical protein [Pyrinomonadaceae bacterium]
MKLLGLFKTCFVIIILFGVSISPAQHRKLRDATNNLNTRSSSFLSTISLFGDGTPILNDVFAFDQDRTGIRDTLGDSIAIDNDTIAIGAPGDDANRGSVYVYRKVGNSWVEEAKLIAEDDTEVNDMFGNSVSLSGDTLIVGTPESTVSGNPVGAAYIFTRTGSEWIDTARLVANDATVSDRFGFAVSIDGDVAAIGAIGDAGFTGSVYIFRRSGSNWAEEDKLTASDAASSSRFGETVAIDNGYVVVGASRASNANGSEAGAAYVFSDDGTGWAEDQILLASDGGEDDNFGGSVAVHSDTIVIGATDVDDTANNEGAAYVFTLSRGTWRQQDILRSTTPNANDRFGSAVAVDGNRAVVGSRSDDDLGNFSGSVYEFTRTGSTWTQQDKFHAVDTGSGDGFGSAVALFGDTIAASSPSNDLRGPLSGSAYVFEARFPGWSQVGRFLPYDGQEDDLLGRAMDIDGDTLLISAVDDDLGTDSGSIYEFTRTSNGWYPREKIYLFGSTGGEQFGSALDLEGDTLVVGAPSNDPNGNLSGSAHVFRRSGQTWQFPAHLLPSDGSEGARFGNAVAIDGNTIAVGAFTDGEAGTGAGAVYVFTFDGFAWIEQQKIIGSDTEADDRFGTSLALQGDTLLIGSPRDDQAGNNAGAVYFYELDNGSWTFRSKSFSANQEPSGEFGTSLAISGSYFVAGAPGENIVAGLEGGAHVYVKGTNQWFRHADLFPSQADIGQKFGESVSIRGGYIVVGAREESSLGSAAGAAFVFRRRGDIWTRDYKLVPNGLSEFDTFGETVVLGNNEVFVGAPFTSISGLSENASSFVGGEQGRAYQFLLPPIGSRFDFDGDSRADVSIFRPGPGEWWYLRSSDGGNYATQFGSSSDVLVPADYTGDGRTDIAFFNPTLGEWFVLRSEDDTFYSFPFGASGDIPAPGDFDGDGTADPAVFRSATATWFILRSSDGQVSIQGFGAAGDKPTIADFDGDGTDDIAIYRPSSSEWWQLRSSEGVVALQFGATGDKAVPADFTGDGKADIAFFRPSNGNWFVLRSEDNSFYSFPFGATGDIPAPADYDGDGTADPTVYRPAGATWFSLQSTAGTVITAFGAAGDQPVPASYVVE